jgi:hypothetical protein
VLLFLTKNPKVNVTDIEKFAFNLKKEAKLLFFFLSRFEQAPHRRRCRRLLKC